jgi:carbamoyl-phosphate synthase large subunit
MAKQFKDIGFTITATKGTSEFLSKNAIDSQCVLKMHEGRPNVLDSIKNGEIKLVVNTPSGKQSQYDDSYIRKAAIKYKIPYITTVAAAVATAKGIAAFKEKSAQIKSLQSYHADIK